MPRHWRGPASACALLTLAAIALFSGTAWAMLSTAWRSNAYTHTLLVLPIVAWLIWRRRAALASLDPRPSAWAAIPMALAGTAWLLATLAEVDAAAQAAFVALLVAGMWLTLGTQVVRELAFPLGFMFFAVPFGDFLVPTLIDRTADFTVAALRVSGIPVHRDGNQFVIPSGQWSVVEACSGVRYLVSSLMVGTLFAHLAYRSWHRRLAFIAAAIAVPIVANWMRAYGIVLLGHLSDNRLAAGVDHLIYGWLFFGAVIVALYFVGARWIEPAPPLVVARPPTGLSGHAPATAVATAIGLMALAWPWGVERWLAPDEHGAGKAIEWSVPLGGARPPDGASADDAIQGWLPRSTGAIVEDRRLFGLGNQTIGVHVAVWPARRRDGKLIAGADPLMPLPDDAWTAEGPGSRMNAPSPLHHVRALTIRRRGDGIASRGLAAPLRLWQVHVVGGHLSTGGLEARAIQLRLRLSGQDAGGSRLTLIANDHDGQADQRLSEFVRRHGGDLARLVHMAAPSVALAP